VALYIAEVQEGETFDPAVHARHDVTVKSVQIREREGEIPEAVIERPNPGIGALADGVPWVHISADAGGQVVHLYHGRLDGPPEALADRMVRLTYIAQRSNYENRVAAATRDLMHPPAYDPLADRNETLPDIGEVLRGYHRTVHVRPTDGAVTTVDAARPGTPVVVDEGHVRGDSLDVRPTGAPIGRVRVTMTAEWTQHVTGTVDVGARLPTIRTLSLQKDFRDALPEDGTELSRQWTVQRCRPRAQTGARNTWGRREDDGRFPRHCWWWAPIQHCRADQTYAIDWTCRYEYKQSRKETATLEVVAQNQPVAWAGHATKDIEIPLRSPADPQTVDGATQPPAISKTQGVFFQGDRGRQSIEHGLRVAAATIAESQRAVDVTLTVPWPSDAADLLALDAGGAATVYHPDLPGGECTGKVTERTVTWQEGERAIRLTLACSLGSGRTSTAPAPEGAYVELGYDQHYDVQHGPVQTNDDLSMTYELQGGQPPGLVQFTDATDWLIKSLEVGNQRDEQLALAREGATLWRPPWAAIDEHPTYIRLELRDLSAVDDAHHHVPVHVPDAYGLPAGIYLEAS